MLGSLQMQIERYQPMDRLKPYVKEYMIIHSESGMQNTILPATSIVLSFRIRGSLATIEHGVESKIPFSSLGGIRKSFREVVYARKAAILLVMFQEGMVGFFFRQPMHEIFGTNISLEQTIPQSKREEAEERIYEARTNQERISIIEDFLWAIKNGNVPDPLVSHMIQKIRYHHGNLKIRESMQGLPTSLDSLEKKFRHVVGTSPKQFSTIVRLQRLLNNYNTSMSLTQAALAAGYFDQAHFIKDFKGFTGQKPKEYFRNHSIT